MNLFNYMILLQKVLSSVRFGGLPDGAGGRGPHHHLPGTRQSLSFYLSLNQTIVPKPIYQFIYLMIERPVKNIKDMHTFIILFLNNNS